MPNFSFLCCLEVVDLWLETKNNKGKKVSMRLMAYLAPARAEVEAVVKADQNPKVALRFHNFGYEFLGVGGDI